MWWRSLWWRLRLRWRLWWCPLGRRSVLIVRILEVELWRCCLWLESLCCLRLECGSLWIESCRSLLSAYLSLGHHLPLQRVTVAP